MRYGFVTSLVACASLLSLCASCGGSKRSSTAAGNNVTIIQSDAITKIGWVASVGSTGVTIQDRGFGFGPSNEFVVAGGYEDQSLTDQPKFVLHDEVLFYDSVAATGSLNLTKVARLPKGVARPSVVTVNNALYILGGYEPTTAYPVVNAKVWRYDPFTNGFVAEADDPEPSAGSYAFGVSQAAGSGVIYRVTPPYQPHQNPLHLGSIGKFQPGGAWTILPLTSEIPIYAASCLFQGKLYVFGGVFYSSGFSQTNTSVYQIDPDTGVVAVVAGVMTKPRVGGVALPSASEIVLIGGDDGWATNREAWPESFDGSQVRDRYDLSVRYTRLQRMTVSGRYIIAFEPGSQTTSIFRSNVN